jgi:CheY-like chemotaxis protein
MENRKQYTIFLVDDDPFLLSMYSTKFKAEGFMVETLTDGPLLLSKIKEGPAPDLILLDMILPSMSGVEILQKIRQDALIPKTKIVILSNQNDTADVEKIQELGADGYLVKASMIPSEVVAEVKKIVAQ